MIEEIFENALWILCMRGMSFNDPAQLRQDAAKKIKQAGLFIPNSAWSKADQKRWENKEINEAKKKIELADEMEKYLDILAEKSGSNIIWGGGRLYFERDYVIKMLKLARRNTDRMPGGYGIIGGTANYLDSIEKFASMADYHNSIIPAMNKFIGLGELHMVSLPVEIKGQNNFLEPAGVLRDELDPRCMIRVSLLGAEKEQLAGFAGLDRFYDSYCPHIGRLNFQTEYLRAALRSAAAGLNQSITSMLRFPFDGNSPERVLTFAAAGLLAMITSHLTISPDIKILSSVMPAVMGNKDANIYDLEGTWLLNAAWGKVIKYLGVGAGLSVGTVTNESEYSKTAKYDNTRAYDFFNKYCPDQIIRHWAGYLNLEIFHLEKFKDNMNWLMDNPLPNKEPKEIFIPKDARSIRDILEHVSDEWSSNTNILGKYHPVFLKIQEWKNMYF